ncbi:hypothetical protein AMTR_s00007p00054200 [Amborella trichopoda]|uniref:Uncharacterized protein n=1 Tax=Amborella trichopoda TaxID=13333 RepID=W1P5T8_AMBTC|nr:hypothetical protein AMTR_s00007p00054200 [Amborella trichopoda]
MGIVALSCEHCSQHLNQRRSKQHNQLPNPNAEEQGGADEGSSHGNGIRRKHEGKQYKGIGCRVGARE